MCYGLVYMNICLFCKYHQRSSESGWDTIGATKRSIASYGLHKKKVYPIDHKTYLILE